MHRMREVYAEPLGPERSALSDLLPDPGSPECGYALLAAWQAYVWLAAVLASRPDDLPVAMAMAEMEDQLLPLARRMARLRHFDPDPAEGN